MRVKNVSSSFVGSLALMVVGGLLGCWWVCVGHARREKGDLKYY